MKPSSTLCGLITSSGLLPGLASSPGSIGPYKFCNVEVEKVFTDFDIQHGVQERLSLEIKQKEAILEGLVFRPSALKMVATSVGNVLYGIEGAHTTKQLTIASNEKDRGAI